MTTYSNDEIPWPLWASQPRERDELAALLGISTRSLRRAVKQGHVELIQGEHYHAPLYRLRDSSWSRKHLEKLAAIKAPVAATSRPNGRHGQGGQNSKGRGQTADETDDKRLNDRGHMTDQSRPTAQIVAATSGRDHLIAQDEIEQLTAQIKRLREDLEEARQESREHVERLERELHSARQQLAALIALYAVLCEAYTQAEARKHLHPLTQLVLKVWSWLKMQLDVFLSK